MNKQQQQDIINKIANLEITTELASYWKKRYENIFASDLFLLSEKTKNILLDDKTKVEKPITPFGDILISRHLDKNILIDELLLQSTIETIVRFLDASLDQINFTPEAKQIVDQYRKIGVGIADFEEYLELKKESAEINEIDYLGNFISTNCYRASETLAEEKGTCEQWESIYKHLRPKPFEYWIHQETKEIKSGLELSETLNQELIKNSKYEIIPRRNSHILIFPVDLEWQIWNDRDETAPETKIQPVSQSKKELKPAGQEILSKTIPLNKTIPLLKESTGADKSKQQLLNIQQSDSQPEELPQLILEESTAEKESTENIPQSNFQIGELVHLKTDANTSEDKIYQVVESFWDKDKKTFHYHLSVGQELEEKVYLESDLEHADVLKILDKFNHTQYKINLFINAIIINQKQEILVEKIEKKLILPGEQVLESIELKEFLANLLKENYNINITDFFETFVVEEIQTETAETDIHLGYLLGVENFDLKANLEWLSLQNIARLFATDRHLALEYIHFIDRYQASVEANSYKKAQTKIVEEMQSLPTEEEIQQRINNEVELRLQEIKEKEELAKELQAKENPNLNQLEIEKERIEQEVREQFEAEKIEYERELKQEINKKEAELLEKEQNLQAEALKLEELQKKSQTTEQENQPVVDADKYKELEEKINKFDEIQKNNQKQAEELKQEKEELLKTLQTKLEEQKKIQTELEKERQAKKELEQKLTDIEKSLNNQPESDVKNIESVEEIEAQKYQSILEQIKAEAEAREKEKEKKFTAEIKAKEDQVKTLEEAYKKRVSQLEDRIHSLSIKQTKQETEEQKKLIDYQNQNLEKRMTNQEMREEIRKQVDQRTKDILARQQAQYNARLQQEKINWRKSLEIETEAKIRGEVAKRLSARKSTAPRRPSSGISTLKIMQKYNQKN